MKKTVAIIGSAPSSRSEVFAIDDPNTEIWGLNSSHSFMGGADRWFQIHRPENTKAGAWTDEHLSWLKNATVPVYMIEVDPEVCPTAVRYPFEAVWPFKNDVNDHDPYFSSSPAYMIALAIHEGFDEIRLIGIDLSTELEYRAQRGGLEFWIAVAMTKGIAVSWPDSSPLCFSHLYGRETQDVTALRNMAVSRLRGHKEEFVQAWAQLIRALAQYEESAMWIDRIKTKDPDSQTKMNELLKMQEKKVVIANASVNAADGQVQETQHWLATMGMADVIVADLPRPAIPKDIILDEAEVQVGA